MRNFQFRIYPTKNQARQMKEDWARRRAQGIKIEDDPKVKAISRWN